MCAAQGCGASCRGRSQNTTRSIFGLSIIICIIKIDDLFLDLLLVSVLEFDVCCLVAFSSGVGV